MLGLEQQYPKTQWLNTKVYFSLTGSPQWTPGQPALLQQEPKHSGSFHCVAPPSLRLSHFMTRSLSGMELLIF